MFDRAKKRRRSSRVIDNYRKAKLVGNFGNLSQIGNVVFGVADRFETNQPCIFVGQYAKCLGLIGIKKAYIDSQLLESLGKKPLEVMRTQEKVFKELKFSKKDDRTDDEWIDIMVSNPILIERPILVYNNKAALGRPPEELLKII